MATVHMDEQFERSAEACRIRDILKRLDYRQRKLHWVLNCISYPSFAQTLSDLAGSDPRFDDSMCFSFTCLTQVADIEVPGQPLQIGMSAGTVRPGMDETMICKMARMAIRELELHEMDEHIFFDDKKIFDPHTEEGQRKALR